MGISQVSNCVFMLLVGPIEVALCGLLAFAFALSLAGGVSAQTFPISGKPVRIIVPFAAGGGADHQARLLARAMTETLGVPVIVENRPGGGSQIGTREVQRAAPDGHTLLYQIGAIVQLPLMSKSAGWNVFTDFTPIAFVVRAHTVLSAHVSAPFNTVPELVAYAKTNPSKISPCFTDAAASRRTRRRSRSSSPSWRARRPTR